MVVGPFWSAVGVKRGVEYGVSTMQMLIERIRFSVRVMFRM